MEYPKSLYLKGWDDLSAHVIVSDAEAEKKARAEGYKSLGEDDGMQGQGQEAPEKVKRTSRKGKAE